MRFGFIKSALGSFFTSNMKRILVVVDVGQLQQTSSPLTWGTGNFGLSTVIKTLRNEGGGNIDQSMRFSVDVAGWHPDKQNAHSWFVAGDSTVFPTFSFHEATARNQLARYDALLLFGWAPGQPNDFQDADRRQLVPASVHAVSAFMATGGVFATGDHADLGADMCDELPRIRSMRFWRLDERNIAPDHTFRTSFQSPHPNTIDRHDTNQPVTALQKAGMEQIPNVENDATGQPGQVPAPFHPIASQRPGIILPDHPHEGQCTEGNIALNFDDKNSWNDYPGRQPDEYHGVNKPREIVMVNTTAHAPSGQPLLHFKGAVDPNHYSACTVYDGFLNAPQHPAGRIVTDSTWHHWLNLNVDPLGIPDKAETLLFIQNIVTWLCAHRPFALAISKLVVLNMENADNQALNAMYDSDAIEAAFDEHQIDVDAATTHLFNYYLQVRVRVDGIDDEDEQVEIYRDLWEWRELLHLNEPTLARYERMLRVERAVREDARDYEGLARLGGVAASLETARHRFETEAASARAVQRAVLRGLVRTVAESSDDLVRDRDIDGDRLASVIKDGLLTVDNRATREASPDEERMLTLMAEEVPVRYVRVRNRPEKSEVVQQLVREEVERLEDSRWREWALAITDIRIN